MTSWALSALLLQSAGITIYHSSLRITFITLSHTSQLAQISNFPLASAVSPYSFRKGVVSTYSVEVCDYFIDLVASVIHDSILGSYYWFVCLYEILT